MIPAISLATVGNGTTLHDMVGPGRVRCGAKGQVVERVTGVDYRVIRHKGSCVCARCQGRRQ